MPTQTFYILGAVHNIVNIDYKKRSEAEIASFDFRIKKISVYGVDDDILEEIKKFPFPFQQLIIKEACAVMNRLEKGKGVPVEQCQIKDQSGDRIPPDWSLFFKKFSSIGKPDCCQKMAQKEDTWVPIGIFNRVQSGINSYQ
ncbi:hypothetical protein RhiirB3_396637 [Rhizophagus irregularis]|nr:hypothetical protein RhiirB3_396637 [Rhizophagus irregularis]